MKHLSFKNEKGFSLVHLVVISGVILAGTAATLKIMDNKVEHLRILKTRTAMAMLKEKIRNVARSRGALMMSASQEEPSGRLRKCLLEDQCTSGIFTDFKLYNSLGDVVSDYYNISGEDCQVADKSDCHLQVTTKFAIACMDGAPTCSEAEEILTQYTIRQINAKYLKGRKFEDITGQESLTTFACPDNKYVRTIDANGKIDCDFAFASLYPPQCPPGQAAYGLTAEGRLQCRDVTNFCNVKVSLATVIDTSGSMNGADRIDSAKASANSFLGFLKTSDTAGAATFADSGELLSDYSNNISQAQLAINGLKARGGTNITGGLEIADKILAKSAPDQEKVIVLLSDGMHNKGASPLAVATALKNKGVRIWAIGLGQKADEPQLRRISSGPDYYTFAPDASALKTAYDSIAEVICRKTP